MSTAKPFTIPKRLIWEAWKQVKSNGGAAGVDGVTIPEFEKDLGGNLYKLWNRMSSGSYMPPPDDNYTSPRVASPGNATSILRFLLA